MLVPGGSRYFRGVLKSSVRNQPPRSTGLAVGLNSSTLSTGGGRSVRDRISWMTMGGSAGGAGSGAPGEPIGPALGRQDAAVFQLSGAARSLTIASEKPKPSVMGNQSSS